MLNACQQPSPAPCRYDLLPPFCHYSGLPPLPLPPTPLTHPHHTPVPTPPHPPVQVLDEQLTDLLRCLPDNPAMHEKVLDSIFSIPSRLTGSGGAAAAALEAPGAPAPVQASQLPVEVPYAAQHCGWARALLLAYTLALLPIGCWQRQQWQWQRQCPRDCWSEPELALSSSPERVASLQRTTQSLAASRLPPYPPPFP